MVDYEVLIVDSVRLTARREGKFWKGFGVVVSAKTRCRVGADGIRRAHSLADSDDNCRLKEGEGERENQTFRSADQTHKCSLSSKSNESLQPPDDNRLIPKR